MPVKMYKFREDKAVSENGALGMRTLLSELYNTYWAVNIFPNIRKICFLVCSFMSGKLLGVDFKRDVSLFFNKVFA